MKQVLVMTLLVIGFLSTTSCSTTKKSADMANKNEISVTGKVTSIENGKDGYMATINTDDNKQYIATISIVNLSRSGEKYQSHAIGDIVTVKGSSWKDAEGKVYITFSELK